jgi:hypothetical protein
MLHQFRERAEEATSTFLLPLLTEVLAHRDRPLAGRRKRRDSGHSAIIGAHRRRSRDSGRDALPKTHAIKVS